MNEICPCCKLGDYKVIYSSRYEDKEECTVHLHCKCKACQTEFVINRYYRLKKEETQLSKFKDPFGVPDDYDEGWHY